MHTWTQRQPDDFLVPRRRLSVPWWLVAAPAVLVGLYLIAQTVGSVTGLRIASIAGPALLGLAAGVAGVQLLRRTPDAVWTPYAWFLLAVVAFYSVGPLVYPLGGTDAHRLSSAIFNVTPYQLVRTNLLDAVGILSVLVGFRIVLGMILGWSQSQSRRLRHGAVRPEAVALVFIILGGGLQYLVTLPARFGMTKVVVPGVIGSLSHLNLLGIALLAYIVARGKGSWRIPLVVLWTLQVTVSLLLFSKLELLLSLALPALAAFAGHRRIRRLVLWALLIVMVYLAVPQLVLYGRYRIYSDAGAIDRAGLVQRAEILREWFARGMPSPDKRSSGPSTGWARLNYAPEQAFAMKRYDDGYPGSTLRNIGVVLMPRILWPDKPVTTDLGVDFYQLVTGRRSTHLGLGIFGEGYWDFGWAGVVGLGLVTGIVFALISGLAVGWMRRRSFAYLPSVLLGIQMGVAGTTENFVNSVLGTGAIFGAYAVASWFVVELVVRHRGSPDLALISHPTQTESSL